MKAIKGHHGVMRTTVLCVQRSHNYFFSRGMHKPNQTAVCCEFTSVMFTAHVSQFSANKSHKNKNKKAHKSSYLESLVSQATCNSNHNNIDYYDFWQHEMFP